MSSISKRQLRGKRKSPSPSLIEESITHRRSSIESAYSSDDNSDAPCACVEDSDYAQCACLNDLGNLQCACACCLNHTGLCVRSSTRCAMPRNDVDYFGAGNWNSLARDAATCWTYTSLDTFDDDDSMVVAAFDQLLDIDCDGVVSSTYLPVVVVHQTDDIDSGNDSSSDP